MSSIIRPIVVLGVQGQVGSELVRQLEGKSRNVRAVTQEEADFSRPESVLRLLTELQPIAVFNAAAYTAVDQAEKEPATAFLINAETPGQIALWCAEHKAPFVHYSTDYVYPGDGTRPWRETDQTGPLSAYGKSKLAGDEAIVKAGGNFLIFRTSWVYAPEGENFLNTMLRLGADREELKVINDQIGAPTLASHLARVSIKALDKAIDMTTFPSGVYHACGAGETNWNGFARAIFEEARARGQSLKVRSVLSIPTSEYPTPAKRPLNSRMSLQKLKDTFGITLPDWRAALHECMEHRQ